MNEPMFSFTTHAICDIFNVAKEDSCEICSKRRTSSETKTEGGNTRRENTRVYA